MLFPGRVFSMILMVNRLKPTPSWPSSACKRISVLPSVKPSTVSWSPPSGLGSTDSVATAVFELVAEKTMGSPSTSSNT